MSNDDLSLYENFNLPYSLEAEQAVLGSILADSDQCVPQVVGVLSPDSFYVPAHRTVFKHVLEMYNNATPIDFITLLDRLKQEHDMANEDAKTFLMQLGQIVPTISNIAQYAKIVREKYYVRSLINMSRDVIEEATDSAADADVLLDSAEQKIYGIRQGKETQGLTHVSDSILELYANLHVLASADGEDAKGVATGISSVDRYILGMNPSDFVLLAARPGVGKTSFALNIATNVALKSNRTVAFFSLEMSKEQLVSRLLSAEAMIDSNQMRTGRIGNGPESEEWSRLIKAGGDLSRSPMYLDDTANITVPEMKARLRRLSGKHKLGLVVIDYLQLMTGSGRRTDNRVQEISEITRSLKIMAKELSVPILTLSQLSRETEKRTNDHRPMLSDLRDSGSIEQDADVVMFLYREEMYAKPEDGEEDPNQSHDCECIIRKNRHGETGTAGLHWDGTHTRFTSLEGIHREYEGV